MKTFLIIFFLLLTEFSSAQLLITVCDATQYIPTSTNIENPINFNLPSINSSRYLNGFDWNQQPNIELTNMVFDGQQLDTKTSLVHSQLGNYYSYLYYQSPGHLLPYSEGWELLLVNIGKYPDDETDLEAVVFRALPYVVLYNRYNGIIRVFVGMGPDATISESADALSVKLQFNVEENLSNYSGILRLYDGHDSALDQPISSVCALSIGKAITEGVRWASVDFQTTFDPCSCKTPTKLNLEFTHIKEQELKLYGREVGITDYDIMTNEMEVNPKDFLSSVSFNETMKDASQGFAINKALQNTLDDYETRYQKYQDDLAVNQQHNDLVNQNLGYVKFAKSVIATVQTLSGGFTSGLLVGIVKNFGLQHGINYLASTSYNSYQSSAEGADWFKSTIKSFPKLIKKINSNVEKIDEKEFYKVLKILMGSDAETFIANNLETTTDPNKPATPTNSITYSEMYFDGKIKTQNVKIGPTFFAPGTFGINRGSFQDEIDGNDAFQFPVYNEILGIFALLESPKIEISKLIPNNQTNVILQNNQRVSDNVDLYTCKLYRHQTWAKQYQVKLVEPLKYKFNNTLDIKDYAIDANFEIIARPKVIGSSETKHSNAFLLKNELINLFSKNTNDDDALPILTNGNPYNFNINSVSPEFNFNLPLEGPIPHENEIKFTSPIIPLDAFSSIISQFSIRNEVVSLRNLGTHSSTTLNNFNSNWLSNDNVYFNNLDQLINLPGVNNGTSHLPVFTDPNQFGYEFDFEIILKLRINVIYNSLNTAGINNTTTMVFSYPIKVDTSLFSNQQFQVVNVGQFPQNLNLNNTNFNGMQVDGCILNGNQYECRAWENVQLSGDLFTSNGYNVLITAGQELEILPETNISSEIVLAIQPILDYSHPMPEASDTYVKNFCYGLNPNAPGYQANTPTKRILELEANSLTNQGIPSEHLIWDFNIYPNPTTSTSTVVISGNNETNYNIEVTDMMGKVVYTKGNRAETTQTVLDLTGISKGVYFVKVNTLLGTKMKQLVIQ